MSKNKVLPRETLQHEKPGRRFFFTWTLPFLLGSLCFVIILLLSWSLPIMKIFELRLYDERMRVWAEYFQGTREPGIVIITLSDDADDNALNADSARKSNTLMRLPRLTRMIRAIHEGGAKVIVLDYLEPHPVDEFMMQSVPEILKRTPLSEVKRKELQESFFSYSPRFDDEFGAAISETRSILACFIEEESQKYVFSGREIRLFAGNENMASATIYYDIDGVVRKVSAYLTDVENQSYYSLSFLAAARYLDREAALQDGTLLSDIPLDKESAMLIHYTGPAGAFTRHFFREIDEKAEIGDTRYFRDTFGGKIVLVGTTDLSSQDLHRTPFNDYKPVCPGVEIQAHAIKTIVNRVFITQAPPWKSNIVLFIVILIYFFLGIRMSPLKSLLLGLCLGAAYVLLSAWLFIGHYHLWIELASPLVALPLVMLCSQAYKYLIVDREKRWLRRALGRYVSDTVAEEIVSNPEMVKLGGEEREISVLFSDINDFTTISEKSSPEELMTMLNEYFALMEEVVFTHGGTLKQFVGDEIMVIFGAPQIQEDHGKRAMLTAIEWMEALEQWNSAREGKVRLAIKIGIHSGRVVVGNVGSSHRTEYAAVGDTVNTAARIMGLTKKLNASTLISAEIYQAVKDLVSARDEGLHQVKGKEQQVRVYSVLGRA